MYFVFSVWNTTGLPHLKLKNTPTCFDHYSDHLQGARRFLVNVTEFKIKKVKGQLW